MFEFVLFSIVLLQLQRFFQQTWYPDVKNASIKECLCWFLTRGFSTCSLGGTWLPDLLLDFDEESHASCSFDDSNILEPHPDEIRLTQEHSYNSFDRQLPKWSYLLDSRRPNFLQDKVTFLQLLAIFFCRTMLFNSSFAPCTLSVVIGILVPSLVSITVAVLEAWTTN